MAATKLIDKTKNALKYTFIFKLLTRASGLIATVLIVRALSEYDYGIYNLLYSVIALITMVASLGIGNTLQRYVPEYYEKGEFKIAHNLYRTASFIRLLTNTAIMGLLLIFWQEIAPVFKIEDHKAYFMLFTLIIFLHMQGDMIGIYLSSYFLHKYSKAIGCIFPLIKAIGYGLIIVFEKNLWYAIITDLLAYFIVFTILQILYFNKIPVSTGSMEHLSKQEKKRLCRYALFYNFNNAGVGFLNANFDNFILVMFLNPVAVGAYSFCVRLTRQIEQTLPLNYFLEVVRPAFFRAQTSSNSNVTFLFQSMIKINTVFILPCFFFLSIFSNDLISFVFNDKFSGYSTILTGVFFFSVINSFQVPVGLVAQLKEKADVILYSKIFAFYNLIADIFLIKLFGIWGAVFATGTAVLGKNLFIWYFVRNEATFQGMGRFFVKTTLFWLAASILIYGFNLAFFQGHFNSLLLGSSLFAVFFLFQFQCNYFTDDEKKVFADLFRDNQRVLYILKSFKMLPDKHLK